MISFQKNISSSFFQYSDRTVASTETNDTSTERSDTQLFEAGKSEDVAFIKRADKNSVKRKIHKLQIFW